jgi:hypothetical protein
MSWVKLDDGFAEDDAVADLSDRAFRLHVIALCYCGRRLTNGHLDRRAVKVVCAILAGGRPNRWVNELVTAGLWIPVPEGEYEINKYLKYNPSREWVEAEREKARERKRKRGSGDGSPDGSAELPPEPQAERSASPSRPHPLKTNPRAVEVDVTNGPEFLATGTEGSQVIPLPELRRLQ